MSTQPQLIAKEELVNIQFAREDALEDPVKIRLRSIYLQKAEKLGNIYKEKVSMMIKTREGKYLTVETTIWAASEEYITIKGGINIPTKAIFHIGF